MFAYCLFGFAMLITGAMSQTSPKNYTFHNKEQELRVKELEWQIVEPSVINSEGGFISHNLHREISQIRTKRDIDSLADSVSYRLALPNSTYPIHIVLTPNTQLYSNNLVIEQRFTNTTLLTARDVSHCHFTGYIEGDLSSKVAVSTCNGLTGMLMTSEIHYFIEPLKGHKISPSKPHPHVIYKSVTTVPSQLAQTDTKLEKDDNSYCSEHNVDGQREDNSNNDQGGKSRRKRSFSREHFVEALVVVDNSMVKYYEKEDINTYIFTIMNMVSILFHDASLGNAVNMNVVRLLLLDEKQEKVEGLSITHHADNTLASFCKWQKGLNPREPNPIHHDVAILITRLDICSRMDEPCSTLGLAEVSGMCQPGRSCNVNEDTGLALAYTIAHELGHNFGMKHDGFNDCSMPTGEKSYIMFPEFLVDAGRPLVWSNCSQQAITRFLDRGWGFCLQDEPDTVYHYPYQDKPPGVLYDVSHQCRLQYGPEAQHCDGIENMCITLWCNVNGRCVSRLEPAAEGTICAYENNTNSDVTIPKKWCFDGECVPINTRPESIDGGWAEWTEWTQCSRSCNGGVSISERHCTNPAPSNGGKYCIGERKKYKICETSACPPKQPNFIETQCSEFNSKPYKTKIYKWEPVSTVNPCQLNCKPKNRYFSVMLSDMVKDGTPCLPGTRNLCITGSCRKVGCDWKLDSNATEDRCGICHGDGTSCKTVKDQFKGQPPQGQGYVEATIIPAGARNIRVEEVAEANNYLAVKSEGDEYYLNGHWYIQWTGNYNMAGTTVHYERLGNKEGITAPGPIKEPLHIMSHNPGVKFEYTVPNQNGTTNDTRIPEFGWEFLDWSSCSVSCGGGLQRKRVVCKETVAGIVEDSYCHNMTTPNDKAKSCNEHLCPARWWTGPWQHCSVSCGEGGSRHRTVLCVRSLGPEEQMALEDEDCKSTPKPEANEPCKRIPPPCPSLWKTGPWSKCVDRCDVQKRDVFCTSNNITECNAQKPPLAEKPCSRRARCGQWRAGDWSKCSKTCEGGIKTRTITCERGDHCRPTDRPNELTACNTKSCIPVGINGEHIEESAYYNRLQRHHSRNQRLPESTKPENKTKTGGDVWSKFWNLFSMGENSQHSNQRETTTQITTTTESVPNYESWHADDWSSCSSTCGTGIKTRRIWCPVRGRCDPQTKPDKEMGCEEKPCLSWVAGSWSHCTVSCGGGSQRRNVQCINLESDQAVSGCEERTKPTPHQECNMDKCNTVSAALKSSTGNKKCEADVLVKDTCEQLKNRGFCTFKYVSRNCCKLCKNPAKT